MTTTTTDGTAHALRIVFLDRGTIAPYVTLRRPAFAHDWTDHDATAEADVVARAKDADIVVTNKVPLRRAAFERLPNLRLIAIAATGSDVIDLDAAAEHGVTVSNIRGYANATVPEHTFALILALRRAIVGYRQQVIDGAWARSGQFSFFPYPILNLAGATLGVIGEGNLGQAVAALGRAFGMTVRIAAHKGRDDMGTDFTPFDEVMRTADVLTLHCPLLPATRNLIGAREFALMERRPLIVNTARGGLVDELALVAALEAGQISGFGFDVTTEEPMPAEHPFQAVLDRPDVIVTPHVAWAGRESMQILCDQLIDNIEAFVAGAPRHALAG